MSEADLTSPGTSDWHALIPPEQVGGRRWTRARTCFRLAMVLYEMATGTLPFRGDSAGPIFDSILNRAPISAVRLNPDLPPALELIINKALEKDGESGISHASEMRSDLKRLKRDTDSRSGSVAAWVGSGASGVYSTTSAIPALAGSSRKSLEEANNDWLAADRAPGTRSCLSPATDRSPSTGDRNHAADAGQPSEAFYGGRAPSASSLGRIKDLLFGLYRQHQHQPVASIDRRWRFGPVETPFRNSRYQRYFAVPAGPAGYGRAGVTRWGSTVGAAGSGRPTAPYRRFSCSRCYVVSGRREHCLQRGPRRFYR